MSVVRGWCPSAHRPMMSGDGLLVRVRPRMAWLSSEDVFRLCDLAERYGNGLIEVTSRGNVQLRGVGEDDHPAVLAALVAAGLAASEARAELPLTVAPFLADDTEAKALVAALQARAVEMPELPEKMGIVVDTGPRRWLADVSGDFRFERGADGLILRADGVARGRPVTVQAAAMALVEMADWFVRTGGVAVRRMRRHVEAVAIPEGWSVAEPLGAAAAPPKPDASRGILGVEFGQLASADLRALMETSGAEGIAVSPWRLLFLLDGDGNGLMQAAETAARCISPALILDASDPRLMVDACPGAPLCGQASVATRDLARRLAGRLAGRALHVSGCSKGCARRGAASVTLVGREGTFDLVLDGNAGDTPVRSGLTEAEVMELLD